MRTTITLSEQHRETLRQIAAERGERGYGKVVEEAIAVYLEQRNTLTVASPTPPAAEPPPPATRAERLLTVLRALPRESRLALRELLRDPRGSVAALAAAIRGPAARA